MLIIQILLVAILTMVSSGKKLSDAQIGFSSLTVCLLFINHYGWKALIGFVIVFLICGIVNYCSKKI